MVYSPKLIVGWVEGGHTMSVVTRMLRKHIISPFGCVSNPTQAMEAKHDLATAFKISRTLNGHARRRHLNKKDGALPFLSVICWKDSMLRNMQLCSCIDQVSARDADYDWHL